MQNGILALMAEAPVDPVDTNLTSAAGGIRRPSAGEVERFVLRGMALGPEAQKRQARPGGGRDTTTLSLPFER